MSNPVPVRVEVINQGNFLGRGGSSMIWEAKTNDDKYPRVALKVARASKFIAKPSLRHEACALLRLKGHPGIPEVYALGRSNFHEYLAMQLLGEHIEPEEMVLTLGELAVLAGQMLDIVRHIHSRGLVHGDIKPHNFLFGRDDHAKQLYLGDYGETTWHTDPETGVPIPSRALKCFRGTPRYCSIKTHYHNSPSRANDMESLAYTITELLRGSLPWERVSIISAICTSKQRWPGRDLCAGYPPVFGQFIDYARRLQFQDEPDYDSWIERFRDLPQLEPEIAGKRIGKSFKDAPNLSSIRTRIQLPPDPAPAWFLPFDDDEDYAPEVGLDLPFARTPESREQIGNEKETVRRLLGWIQAVEMEEEICNCVPEQMLNWEDEDEQEKEFGEKYRKEIDD